MKWTLRSFTAAMFLASSVAVAADPTAKDLLLEARDVALQLQLNQKDLALHRVIPALAEVGEVDEALRLTKLLQAKGLQENCRIQIVGQVGLRGDKAGVEQLIAAENDSSVRERMLHGAMWAELANGKIADAKAYLKTLPFPESDVYYIAERQAKTGDMAGAKATLKEFGGKESGGIYANLAEALLLDKKEAEAKEMLEFAYAGAVRAKDRDKQRLLMQIANIEALAGNGDEALKLMREWVPKFPTEHALERHEMYVAFKLLEHGGEKSIKLAREIAAGRKDDSLLAQFEVKYALVLYRAKDTDGAEREIVAATARAKRVNDLPRVWIEQSIALAEVEMQNPTNAAAAIDAVEKVIAKDEPEQRMASTEMQGRVRLRVMGAQGAAEWARTYKDNRQRFFATFGVYEAMMAAKKTEKKETK